MVILFIGVFIVGLLSIIFIANEQSILILFLFSYILNRKKLFYIALHLYFEIMI
jgi:hypothetical protein